jgi:DNA-binding CsgD family transcriptional regulator
MSPHLQVAILILSLAAGTASLIVLAAAYRASGSFPLGLFAIFSACLLFLASRTLAVDYLSLNTGSRLSSPLVAVFFRAPALVTALMVGILPFLARGLFGPPPGKAVGRFLAAAIAIVGLVALTPLYGSYDRARGAIAFGPARYPVAAILLATAAWAIARAAVGARRLDPSLAPMVRKAVAAFAVFLPFLALDLFYSPGPGAADATPFLPGFFPLFLIAVSAGSVFYGIRYLLRRPAPPSAPSTGPDEAPVMERLASRLDALSEGKGLTAREREVARLALGGASSKEIARELRISRRTADNHLYRLYLKLGIESRYELTALLSSPARPD